MEAPLSLLFDFRDPASYLALEPTFALIDELKIPSHCEVLLVAQSKPPREPGSDGDRGSWHRWHRARYREMDLHRYMESRGLRMQRIEDGSWYQPSESRVAAQGAAWVAAGAPQSVRAYMEAVFDGYWSATLSVDSATDIGAVLEALGLDTQEFSAYLQGSGPQALDARQSALSARGYFDTPAYLVGAEVYYGRQHLPLIRRQLRTSGL